MHLWQSSKSSVNLLLFNYLDIPLCSMIFECLMEAMQDIIADNFTDISGFHSFPERMFNSTEMSLCAFTDICPSGCIWSNLGSYLFNSLQNWFSSMSLTRMFISRSFVSARQWGHEFAPRQTTSFCSCLSAKNKARNRRFSWKLPLESAMSTFLPITSFRGFRIRLMAIW